MGNRSRAANLRLLSTLLIGVSLLGLSACTKVQDHVPSPEPPSLNMRRLPLHAVLVVPDAVQTTISEMVVTCRFHFNTWTLKFPVGELVSSAAEKMLSQLFISVNRVNDKAAAHGVYDVFVELSPPVIQMENDCSKNYVGFLLLPLAPYLPFGGPRDLNVRLSLGGAITDQGGSTPLGEASFEAERLPLVGGIFNTYKVEEVSPHLEQALLETMAGLVNRLATKPKFMEYARSFKAPQQAPLSGVPITPDAVITAPPIY